MVAGGYTMMNINRMFRYPILLSMLCVVTSVFAGNPTYSVDVYPFTFGSTSDTTEQLSLWNRLMKYKLFATGLANGQGIYV